ncbi:MAG: membrane protein insertase YidC [Myxococcota bacterium]
MSSSRQLLLIAVLAAAVAVTFMSPPEEEGAAEPAEAPTSEAETARTLTDDERAARQAQEERFTLETDEFVAEFSNLNTGLVSLRLKGDKFRDPNGEPHQLVTTDQEAYYAQQIDLEGLPIDDDAVWEGRQVDERTLRFEWRGSGFTVVRQIQAGAGPYQLWSTTRVVNRSGAESTHRLSHRTYHYVSAESEGGGMAFRPSTTASFGICDHGEDEVERATTTDLVEEGGEYTDNVLFAGIADSYFANAIAVTGGQAERCVMRAERRGGTIDDYQGSLLDVSLRFPETTLPDGDESITRVLGYVGPTDRSALRAAGHSLTQLVDLGWFSFIANGFSDLLSFIQGYVGNWGLAIILLTLMVKLLFFPITFKSMKSMARMRHLKPQMDAINEKYADDKEAKGAAVMALYKKEGVNPVSGCLPMLMQTPVWIALYRSLSTNIELYNSPFVWYWTDLSSPDPYFVLPAFVGILMHIQQRFTPNAMDSQQAKILMYVMPLVIGGFMLFLPAGLCLYMVTNSTLTMIQQRAIYAQLDKEVAQTAPALEPEDDEDGPQDSPEKLTPSSSSATRRSLPSRKKRKARG